MIDEESPEWPEVLKQAGIAAFETAKRKSIECGNGTIVYAKDNFLVRENLITGEIEKIAVCRIRYASVPYPDFRIGTD